MANRPGDSHFHRLCPRASTHQNIVPAMVPRTKGLVETRQYKNNRPRPPFAILRAPTETYLWHRLPCGLHHCYANRLPRLLRRHTLTSSQRHSEREYPRTDGEDPRGVCRRYIRNQSVIYIRGNPPPLTTVYITTLHRLWKHIKAIYPVPPGMVWTTGPNGLSGGAGTDAIRAFCRTSTISTR